MFEQEVIVNKLLVDYLHQLTVDIPELEFSDQAIPNTNSPAWVVGHLILEAVKTLNTVGIELELPSSWSDFFMQETLPKEGFPVNDELLIEFQKVYATFREQVLLLTEEQYLKNNPSQILATYYPQLKDDISHVLTAHLGIHCGHIGMWRKAKGLKNIYGKG